MDAGCGTGLLTKDLAKKVPSGKVYAVDIDSNMIEQARSNLRCFDNVEIVQSSFTDVKLPTKVDVIFSNSAFHWVQDHRKAFQSFWGMLKPAKSHKVYDGSYPSQTDSSAIVNSVWSTWKSATYYRGIRKNCTFTSIQSILHRMEATMAFC
jgi:trans-aconitate methyltransferase